MKFSAISMTKMKAQKIVWWVPDINCNIYKIYNEACKSKNREHAQIKQIKKLFKNDLDQLNGGHFNWN
jgi:hypothetical protein